MGFIGDIKDVANIILKAGNIDLHKKVLDLQAAAMEMVEQNNNLQNEIRELKDKINTKEKLVIIKNIYWIEEGDKRIGPYCTRCWDSEAKLINHQDLKSGYYSCPNCKMTVENENYQGRTTVQHKEHEYFKW